MVKFEYLIPIGASMILIFVLFFIASSGASEKAVPFSLEAFAQPYAGENALLSLVLLGIAVIEIPLNLFYFLPQSFSDPKKHLMALTAPEIITVLGFVVGFLNYNPWAALPFFATTLLLWLYAYARISQQQTM